jgi:hypothetical protein
LFDVKIQPIKDYNEYNILHFTSEYCCVGLVNCIDNLPRLFSSKWLAQRNPVHTSKIGHSGIRTARNDRFAYRNFKSYFHINHNCFFFEPLVRIMTEVIVFLFHVNKSCSARFSRFESLLVNTSQHSKLPTNFQMIYNSKPDICNIAAICMLLTPPKCQMHSLKEFNQFINVTKSVDRDGCKVFMSIVQAYDQK